MAFLVNGPKKSWDRSLRRLDRPPPRALTSRYVAAITLWEHFVHHEDVRRPNGIEREHTPMLEPVLEWIVAYNGHRIERTMRLVTPNSVRSFGTGPEVTMEGSLPDLILWLSGRDVGCVASDASTEELNLLRDRLAT